MHSIQKLVVLLIPGLTSTILSLPPLPTSKSATSNPDIPIPIPHSLDPAFDPSDLPTSIDPHLEEAMVLYESMAVFHSPHTHFLMRVPLTPWETQYACTQSSRNLFRPLSVARRKRDAYRSAFLVCVLLPFTLLRSFTYITAVGTKNKNPAQYLKCTRANG